MWQIDHYCLLAHTGEDRSALAVTPHGAIIAGVFDGHGGSETAHYCKERFPEYLRKITKGGAGRSVEDAFQKIAEGTRSHESGCAAAVLCLWPGGKVVGAVLGDSQIFVRSPYRKLFVSPHHNIRTNIEERQSAIARGGKYRGGYICPHHDEWGLQMGRAFGDRGLYPILSTIPDIFERNVLPGGWVAVLSDGVLDPSHPTYISESHAFARMIEAGADAQTIVSHFQPKKGDDASLFICRRMK